MDKKIKISIYSVAIIILFIIGMEKVINKVDVTKYFENKSEYTALGNTILRQEKVNEELEKLVNDKEITLEKAKVIVNPYEISPLTALIIFYTEKSESVELYINGELQTKFEASKKHSIPVYGLLEDYKNEVKIKVGNVEKVYEIETEKAEDVNPLKVEVSKKELNNELYFFSGPMGTGASAYDKEGNLRWYLTERYCMDFEWLDNGHFLIGIIEGSVADRKIGFVEMDYLGKIYNYYASQNGFEFEFQELENGNYLIAGGNEAIFYEHPYIYEINKENGKMESYLDLYKVFTEVDPDFNTSKLNWTIIRNGFALNEKTGEIVISLRGLDAVIGVDYKKNKLNWIFTESEIFGEKFDDYKVELVSGRYPKGQHATIITKEGYIGYINNDYERLTGYEAGGKDLVSDYEGIYETAEIYEIKDKKATLKWSYGDNLNLFGQLYGSLYEVDNDNKLINFGFVMKESYKNKKGATLSESEATTKYSHALLFEVDENDKVLFKATIEDAKYRAFKHGLYNELTENTNVEEFNIFNTIDKTKLEKIKTKKIIDNLDNATDFTGSFEFTNNVITTDYKFNANDKVEILLIGEKNNSYKFTYKDEEVSHINLYNVKLKGKYSIYFIINGVYYDTNYVTIFE